MPTAGSLLINDILPPELRDPNRVLDKKGLKSLLSEVANRYPEKYPEILGNALGLNSELVLKSYQVAEMDDAEIDRMSDEELELFLTTPVGEKPTLDKLPFYGE